MCGTARWSASCNARILYQSVSSSSTCFTFDPASANTPAKAADDGSRAAAPAIRQESCVKL